MIDLDLLPSDPVAFFGLNQGYDRRDLKRSYGKAIRQYKPETHPAEFQLIRDAYERLEKLLRYGKQQQKSADAAAAWTIEKPSAESSRTDRRSRARSSDESASAPESRPTATLSLQQMAVVDPQAALKQLQTKTRRSPQDYYLAAVLADATAGKPTSQYLGQLIEGLIAFPSDSGLTVLATEYLRLEVPETMAEKVVRFVAKKIRSPLFYMLTEPLWIRLVDTSPFGQIEPLLRDCERDIQQTEPTARITFYLRLLRSAIWTAPAEWTQRVINEIESQSAGLDDSSQGELEFLVEIQDLLQSQSTAASNDPIRGKLIHAIRLACRSDDGASTAEIIQTLNEIAKDASGVQDAFPLDGEGDDAPWVTLTYSLVHQMQSYLDEPHRIPDERIATQTVHLVADLEPTLSVVTSSYQRAQWRYKTVPLIAWLILGTLFLGLPLVTLLIVVSDVWAGLFSIFGIVVLFVTLILSFYRWLYPTYLSGKEESMHRKWAMRDYAKHWRGRLFRYAQSCSITMEAQLAFIQVVCNRGGQQPLGYSIDRFVRQDPGLCIFAGLQTLLR